MKSMGSGLNSGRRPATIAKSVTPNAQTYVRSERGEYVGGVGVVGLVQTALGRVEVGGAGGVGHEARLRARKGVQRAGGLRQVGVCV